MRNRIDNLIEYWDPILRDKFLEAVGYLRDDVQIGVVTRMLEAGNIDGAVRAVNLDPVAFRVLDNSVMQAFEAGGNAAMARIPAGLTLDGFRLNVRFDVRNLEAETWLRTNSAQKITAITDDMAVAVRNHLAAGMEAGLNPRTVALDLVGRIDPVLKERTGGVIGLTSTQEEWTRNYATELMELNGGALSRKLRDARFDRTVQTAIEENSPLSANQIDDMVSSYRNRALFSRAEAIGRTEAMAAMHESQDQAFQQAVDSGQVKKENITRIWHTSQDRKVRESHQEMDEQQVGFDEDFVCPSGATLAYPGDPNGPPEEIINCRCWAETKVDYFADIE